MQISDLGGTWSIWLRDLILIGYATTTGSFGRAVDFMFTPNWDLVTGKVILAALGHAFFTLSLGMGIMLAYGSYFGNGR